MKIITIPILCGQLPKFLGGICYEGDCNVQRLEFTGAEPNLEYKLDLERSDGAKNVLDLVNQNGTLILTLDESVFIPSGRYHAQLRTVGNTVWHSNKAFLTVRESIGAVDSFGERIPTEMAQMEARITSVANHPPVPGEHGKWMLWDPVQNCYIQSDMETPRGDTPQKGVDYWTETDKAELVVAVLSALPVAEGGAY